jgi:hypothetical protein
MGALLFRNAGTDTGRPHSAAFAGERGLAAARGDVRDALGRRRP